MSSVFNWAEQPKIQEPIEIPIDVGESTAYITGSRWYNAKTKQGKVTVNFNLSAITFNENEVNDIFTRFQQKMREHYIWLRQVRMEHHAFLEGVDPDNQMTLDDELNAARAPKKRGRPKKKQVQPAEEEVIPMVD